MSAPADRIDPADEDPDEFTALLDGIYLRRRAELLDAATALVADVDAWCAGTPGAGDRVAATAHRLSGGLGTLGFDDLSQAARTLEQSARRPVGDPDSAPALARRLLGVLQRADRRPLTPSAGPAAALP